MKRGLGTILWAIDENMGTNLQAVTSINFVHRLSENTKTGITFCKKKKNIFLFLNNSGRALYNRAGRKTVRAGHSALRNMPSWNTASAIYKSLSL